MKTLNEKVVQQVANGYEFGYSSGGYSYTIRVNMSGEVTFADYGSQNGWCSRNAGEADFESTVMMAMEGILDHDREEFVKMRDHLNSKFRGIAESVRMSKMSKWNF